VTDNYYDDPSRWRGQVLHDLGHEAINRLVIGMSKGVKKRGIAVVGLNPGFMRTEAVLQQMTNDQVKRQFRFDLSESPEYIGRAVVALASDPNVHRRNGKFLWVAELAGEYGFTDVDGRYIPRFDPAAPMQEFPC
jgi:NAD(P)-dependent dehydrogenase (short-subunit alcohol dehydrogenase family)